MFYDKVEDKHFRFFNIGFMVVSAIFSILSPFIPFSLMMNIVGAVVCYFFIYLFPTLMHYTCFYNNKRNEESLVESITSLEETDNSPGECCHGSAYSGKKPKWLRFIIYGVINVIGIAIGCYGLYTCVNQIMG